MATTKNKNMTHTRKALFVALLAIVVLSLVWHLFFPMVGLAIAVGAAAWSVIVGSIVFLSLAVLLFYLISGLGIILLSLIACVWVIYAVVLYPFFFPILAPMLIIVLFIAYVRRNNAKA